jgi:hypothetical protein
MTQTKNLLTKRKNKPAYMQSLNEAEKAENFKIIDNMSKKVAFLKNPRYKISKTPIIMTQVIINITAKEYIKSCRLEMEQSLIRAIHSEWSLR